MTTSGSSAKSRSPLTELFRGFCLIATLFAAAHAAADPVLLVDYSKPEAAKERILPRDAVSFASVGDRQLAYREPNPDPYGNTTWTLPVPELAAHAGETVVLQLHFRDVGAGVLDAALRWGATGIAPARRASYTRCNTGEDRLAAYEFALPKDAPADANIALDVNGLQYPLRLVLQPKQDAAYWSTLQSLLPKKNARPVVDLHGAMRLVTTAGIDVMGGYDTLDASLEQVREIAPLCRALGMTSVEGYVSWKRLEPRREGEFDFSFYDAIVNALAEYDLKFFPLLIVGSGYALPEWFIKSPDNIGFKCLEHGIENPIQSIWSPTHRRHVERVLQAFGNHYGPMHVLEAVRLGPSGNYGESQYPAGGNWGPRGEEMHIHIGWWAGDRYARDDFRKFLTQKYGNIASLNAAWGANLASLDAADCAIPETMVSRRQRADFTQWYTDSMTRWCNEWGAITRAALPDTPIYQSAGGWGFREAGTEYSAQAEGMIPIGGGIRLTNETDSYEQNVYATRLAATAAKLYNLPLGYEPASGHTARGIAGRIFNTLTTNGDHLFTYQGNLINSQLSIQKWVDYLPLFETRRPPLIEVAVYYPETDNQLGDAAFRHLYAWGFNPRAAAVRRVVDVDYLDDHLLRGGFLDRYKVLVFAWGEVMEADVQQKVDAWVRAGGTLLYTSFPRGPLRDVEGESKFYSRWAAGNTGAGRFARFQGDMEPPSLFSEFVRTELMKVDGLNPWTRLSIAAVRPDQCFLSVQDDGHLLALNYTAQLATVVIDLAHALKVEPYGIARMELPN